MLQLFFKILFYIENTYFVQEDQNKNFPIRLYGDTTNANIYTKIPKVIQLLKISCHSLISSLLKNSTVFYWSSESWLDKQRSNFKVKK